MRRLTPREAAAAGLMLAAALAVVLSTSGGSGGVRHRASPATAGRPLSPAGPRRARGGARHRTTAGPRPRALSIQELAGQRVIFSYTGLRPPRALVAAIRAGEAAGVIFFGSNIAGPGQLREVTARLQAASLASPLHDRLLLLADQEGGEVRRLPGAPSLSEREIGEAAGAGALAADAGTGAGRNLAGSGLNVNLAPVEDVYDQPGNFIDSAQRSYSSSPDTAGALGAAFIAAQQRLGVAATAKHFPGLGSATTDQDTDVRPVTLPIGLAALRAGEAPFRQAIDAGVKLVMSSWAVYPALVPAVPAGLSRTIIEGELRGRLGFHGVTITDAIGAGAIAAYGNVGTRAVLAAEAGNDLILAAGIGRATNSPRTGLLAERALAAAIAGHQISRAAARSAAARVLALRAHP